MIRASSVPRILSGRWKGRALKVPKSARPTSSRAREALFDILQNDVAGSRFLDLFAGSGAVGLEALLRLPNSSLIAANRFEAIPRRCRTLSNTTRLGW